MKLSRGGNNQEEKRDALEWKHSGLNKFTGAVKVREAGVECVVTEATEKSQGECSQ